MTTYSAKVKIANTEIDNLTFQQAIDRIIELSKYKCAHFVVTPNADHIVRLQNSTDFIEVYQKAALIVADGMPLIWAAKWLKTPLRERVTGADLLPALCEAAAKRGLSIFLLGAPEGVGVQAAQNLQQRYAGLKVAGVYSPPFGFERDPRQNELIIKLLNDSKADIVFVGLGSPKQEVWMAQEQKRLNVGVMLGIGAAIAFAAGTEKRAPLWMQKTGLEWLYRLSQDPKRLAKRYWDDFAFFKIIYRQWRGEI